MNIAGTQSCSEPPQKTCQKPLRVFPVLFFSIFLVYLSLDTAAAHPLLTVQQPLQFQATGAHEARVAIPEFGLYSIYTQSAQGTAVQLVDRMNGPGEIRGEAGVADGRVDAFLDQAEYKVLTRSDKKGSGNGTLTLKLFEELNPEPVQLVEFKDISTTLGDFQKRSFWLEIKERRWVALEAVGRHLSKLKLWRDGVWLVDTREQSQLLEPVKGQPLMSVRMAVQLNPGWYLVSAYGGPSQSWAKESPVQPLHVRMGIPKVGVAERGLITLGLSGVHRLRVSGMANYFRIDKIQRKKTQISEPIGKLQSALNLIPSHILSGPVPKTSFDTMLCNR